MKRLLPIALFAWSLAACVATPPPAAEEAPWKTFSDDAFGISFSYDPMYSLEDMQEEEIMRGESPMRVYTYSLRTGMPESSFIQVMQTTDPRIKDYLKDMSSETSAFTLNTISVQEYIEQGMGDPISYLFESDGAFTVLQFVFAPSREDIDRTLRSVVLR